MAGLRHPYAALAGAVLALQALAQQPAGAPPPAGAAPPPPPASASEPSVLLYDPAPKEQRGRQFDSSRERGQPFSFPLGAGRVIRGWEQGIPGMKVGGTRRLVIPPELAYGSRGAGNGVIPPQATLMFEVELLGVETVTRTEGA
jgi:FKBP-type peptidyl-prolyl cis-trans isomerase FkpA